MDSEKHNLVIHNFPIITSAYVYELNKLAKLDKQIISAIGVNYSVLQGPINEIDQLKNIKCKNLLPLSAKDNLYAILASIPILLRFPQLLLCGFIIASEMFKYFIFVFTSFLKNSSKPIETVFDFKEENSSKSKLKIFYYSILGFLNLSNEALKAKNRSDNIYCENLTTLLVACLHKKKFKSKIIFYSSKITWDGGFLSILLAKFERQMLKNVDSFFYEDHKSNKKKVLVVSKIHPDAHSNLIDYIEALNLKECVTFNLNLFYFKNTCFNHSPKIRISEFDFIIFHPTSNVNDVYFKHINYAFDQDLSEVKAKKIVIKQDELINIHSIIDSLDRYEVDYLFSCVSSKDLDKIYPTFVLPKLKKESILTGYVSDSLRNYRYKQITKKFDIVYRGMKMPYYFGKLAQEKYDIGVKFIEVCERYNLKYDISCDNKDKILGKKWLRFLSSSKATLAVPSGGSIIDFTGQIKARVQRYLDLHPNADFSIVYEKMLSLHDGKLIVSTISPRHLEAVAAKTVLIMPHGSEYYSNIFKPDVHYIELNPNFDNIEDVVAKLRDNDFCNFLTENAYRDIILNDIFHFNKFAQTIKDIIVK